ncbi:unnamed protein product, partial [Heterosigma akashiwo]
MISVVSRVLVSTPFRRSTGAIRLLQKQNIHIQQKMKFSSSTALLFALATGAQSFTVSGLGGSQRITTQGQLISAAAVNTLTSSRPASSRLSTRLLTSMSGGSTEPYTCKASHILVKTEDEINLIFDGLQNAGWDFANVAKESSQCPSGKSGGDLGWFGKGMMVPEFEQAAFQGKVGDLVKVKTQFGWHVLRVDEQSFEKPKPEPLAVRARHILVQDEGEADLLMEQIQGGSDFEGLAQQQSRWSPPPPPPSTNHPRPQGPGWGPGLVRAQPDGEGVRGGLLRRRGGRPHEGQDAVRLARAAAHGPQGAPRGPDRAGSGRPVGRPRCPGGGAARGRARARRAAAGGQPGRAGVREHPALAVAGLGAQDRAGRAAGPDQADGGAVQEGHPLHADGAVPAHPGRVRGRGQRGRRDGRLRPGHRPALNREQAARRATTRQPRPSPRWTAGGGKGASRRGRR